MATDHVSPDGQFWLPPRFLPDDDLGVYPGLFPGDSGSRHFPPVDFGTVCMASNLSSPGGSVVGSAEESDTEEDFIADLTRKVAQSTLEDDFAPRNYKGLFPSGSPKSTLCGACGCGHASSRGSPNGAIQAKPVQALTQDVLYQVAGKVADMRLSHQQQQVDRARYLHLQQQRLDHLIQLHNSKSDVSFSPNQAASHLSALQLNYLLSLSHSRSKYAKADTAVSSSVWPTLQQAQQPLLVPGNANPNGGSTGMRAVFLGSSNGSRRGSTGTGVFLPRRAGVDSEPKRKHGCSTVLIPAKVAQALNLNLDQVNTPLNGRPVPECDGAWRIRNGRHLAQQQLHLPQQRAATLRGPPAVHPELSLPSEWTY